MLSFQHLPASITAHSSLLTINDCISRDWPLVSLPFIIFHIHQLVQQYYDHSVGPATEMTPMTYDCVSQNLFNTYCHNFGTGGLLAHDITACIMCQGSAIYVLPEGAQ